MVKAYELRSKKRDELLKELEELKKELATLRVAQATNGAASKLGKIKDVRKSIARVLTVINQTAMAKFREEIKDAKYKPKLLRAKKTRALRRALTTEQANKKTVKALKKAQNFPVRKFALKA